MKRSASMLAMAMLMAAAPAYAAKKLKVPMSFVTAEGVGKSAGTVTVSEGKDGVTLLVRHPQPVADDAVVLDEEVVAQDRGPTELGHQRLGELGERVGEQHHRPADP